MKRPFSDSVLDVRSVMVITNYLGNSLCRKQNERKEISRSRVGIGLNYCSQNAGS